MLFLRVSKLSKYSFVDDTFVNLILVREGLARVYIIQPDTKYLNQFEQAFLLARNENGCIWKVLKFLRLQQVVIVLFYLG